jgi:hypothetical protein
MKLIILTCSISPFPQPDLAIADSETRLADYVISLKFWNEYIKTNDTHIWVLENTNSLSKLEKATTELELELERIRFIQIPLDVNSQNFGKSAGEYEMLKSIMEEVNGSSFEQIIKVTGRLYVRNFEKCLENMNDVDFASGRFYFPNHIIDSRFFSMRPAVYEFLFGEEIRFTTSLSLARNIDSRTYLSMEHYLAYCSLELESRGFSVKSFLYSPMYFGQSASTGKTLNSPIVDAKITISNFFRRVAIKFLSGYAP